MALTPNIIKSAIFIPKWIGAIHTQSQRHTMAKHYEDWHTLFPNSGKGKEFPWMRDTLLRFNPKSVLDYGCGKGGTADYIESTTHFKVDRYDPGYQPYSLKPTKTYDFVYSTDVFEHIELEDVGPAIQYINTLTTRYHAHIIDLDPARKHLPDGRNAHVTLLDEAEWLNTFNQVCEVVDYTTQGYEDKYLPQRTRLHVVCLAHS